MWMFLITEVLFFAGVMCAYTVYRLWFPKDFEAGSAALNVGIASVNTFILLLSSLTITLAIRACYDGDQAGLKRYLMGTMLLAVVFIGLKLREYQLDYVEGLIPSKATVQIQERASDGSYVTVQRFAFEQRVRHQLEKEHYDCTGVNFQRVQLFFLCYYIMTGLHVLHMIVGIGLLAWQYVLAQQGFFRHKERFVYVEVMSLYWHFVDMVWIFLLPLLYLCGPHSLEQAMRQFSHAIGMGS